MEWKNHPFTLAMPPYNITILAICTVCAGGGVFKLVHHHIPSAKLTQRDDNTRITISYLHPDASSVLRRVQGVKRYHDDSHCACPKALLSRESTSCHEVNDPHSKVSPEHFTM